MPMRTMRRRTVPDRLAVFDGLRGFAILLVIWYHVSLVSGYAVPSPGPLAAVWQNGFLGVDLFFFVSGFCICYPYARARHDGKPHPSTREFARRRALKILPSYALALVVFACVFHAHFASAGDELADLGAHLAFLHTWYWPYYGAFSGPLWTLGVEVQFYVVFAALAGTIRRRPLGMYAAFVIASLAYRFGLMLFGVDADFGWVNQLPGVLDLFGAGMMTSFAYVEMREDRRPDPRIASSFAIVAAAAMFLGLQALSGAHARGDDDMHRWLNLGRTAIGPLLAVFTLGTAFGVPALRAAVTWKPLTLLSIVSYNAYLWNLELSVAVANAGVSAPVAFVVGIVLTLAVSTGLTYAFERPILRGALDAAWTSIVRPLAGLVFVGGRRSRTGEV